MSGLNEQISERDEIEMLLPWYVTGRLDAGETARVAAYLERHPEVRSQLSLVRDERSASISSNEAIRARLPSAETIVAGAITPAERARSWLAQRMTAVKTLFESPTPGAIRWATAAAALIICLQAVTIGSLLTRESPGSYGTASRPGAEAQTAPVAMIAFADTASAATIATLLENYHLRIIDGPLPGGFYSVRFADDAPVAEQQRRLSAIHANKDIIKLVLPSR